jgi:adenylate cyclase
MAEFSINALIYMAAGYTIFLALFFAARGLRLVIAKRERPLLLHYHGGRVIEAAPGATVLEILRAHRIPHASVCGGRGRCSTCRIRVGRGADWLNAPDDQERHVLERISAPPAVRLACQVRPTVDLEIAPLLPSTATASDGFEQPGYLAGQEMEATFVFIDLRGSTGLSEGRLPYDFVFILNQFFAAIDAALQDTGGHYAQFNGDGLMAIYGLESGLHQGAMEALQGAQEMMKRIDQLNESLRSELPEPLAIGIGIHSGEAIVGSMGPPDHPIISAIGDNVNIAARLEALCKEFQAPLIVSEITCERAGVDFSGYPLETVEIRGRQGSIDVRLIDDPRAFDLMAQPLENEPATAG